MGKVFLLVSKGIGGWRQEEMVQRGRTGEIPDKSLKQGACWTRFKVRKMSVSTMEEELYHGIVSAKRQVRTIETIGQ